jgi:uncharacterized protein YndB with AHSA1/START domain
MTRDDAPMGVVLGGDRPGIRFERHLRHSPDKVWRALTESDHLRSWMPCDIVGPREQGAQVELPFWPEVVAKHNIEQPVLSGTIRVWDPPRVFEWTWDTDVLRWELEHDGAGTVLTFTTWLGDADPSAIANTAAGYHVCLAHLIDLLDTGHADSVANEQPTELEARYSELVRATS